MIQPRRDFLKQAALAVSVGAASGIRSLKPLWAAAGTPSKYEPNWESLSQYQVPDWYRDAKFGIFLHWGVYSVPAHSSEWYPRLMYRREDECFKWHQEHWGPQSIFGYKDFIPMFKAEHWDPALWVELFRKAGAKYIVPVGEHHDGYPMYDSLFTTWNAAKTGPHRDVVAELGRNVREQGLKLGVSSHRAFDWSYYTFEKDFDTSNLRFSGLYGTPHAPTAPINNERGELRQTVPVDYLQDWYGRTIQIVDQYEPDLVWFDFGFEGPEWEPYRKAFGAYYYNRAEAWQKGLVINYKHEAYPPQAAVLDIERGLLNETPKYPWQTDTSVSWESWGYIQNDRYKTPGEIVRELIDIVSKNGSLLLNVGPMPDGRIPEPAEQTLLAMGQWLATNAEAIYGTRPWKVSAEGPTKLNAGQFGEKTEPSFTAQDIRFTSGPGAVYAIALAWPEKELLIQSLGSNGASGAGLPAGSIADVQLLGSGAKLDWNQTGNGLRISAPASKSGDFAYVFKVSLKDA